MSGVLILVCVAALVLAFANGANDNAKGVATLVGGQVMSLERAVRFAAGATFLGSLTAVWWAQELADKFSGKGLVDASLVGSGSFLLCVGLAAAITVLLATWLSLPISTTHALVGSIVGAGISAGALNWGPILDVFFKPLIVAPMLAVVVAAVLYVIFRFVRLRAGIHSQTCICIKRTYHPVTVEPDGALRLQATGVTVESADAQQCVQRYEGRIVGVGAQQILDACHVFSGGAISFARGLNDTPKIAGLIIGAGALAGTSANVAVGIGIALGGMLAVRRVARTMSYRITDMNDGQAFTANLTTALLVIVCSRYFLPVSTTHVSCGSLFGIGLVNRQAKGGMIGQILLAWLITLPMAAALAWVMWRLLAA